MPDFSAGARLGHYELLALLGEGGMGQVYRARDTRLGRHVAIKVLQQGFAQDHERVARFQREAQMLASLNHPHIAAIYDLVECEGTQLLVLELVEGESLDQHIRRGPLPLDRVLAIAREAADALAAAHEKGIVHRDVKPANIAIARDGHVKVLDFGLAKAVGGMSAVDLTRSPTMTSAGTLEGAILGTAAYMSPEQARGQPVDKRTDVWGFGCTLFEMVAQRPPFPQTTLADLIVAIVQQEPDWSTLRAPAALVRLVRHCLAKDPHRRLRDLGDVHLFLDDDVAEPGTSPSAAAGLVQPALEIGFHRLTDVPGAKEAPAISPDGKMVAFVAMTAGRRQIFIRLLAGGAPLQLTRDDADHLQPRWAPDSSTLVYYVPGDEEAAGTLWETSALGGWPRLIAPCLSGGDISHDGRRIAVLQLEDGRPVLMMLTRDGSPLGPIQVPPAGFTCNSPRWSPDDRFVAFKRASHSGFVDIIEVVPVDGGPHLEVARQLTLVGFAWLPDASGFVYGSSTGSTLLYPPTFNLRAVSMDGLREQQLTAGDVSFVEPDVHASGKLLAVRIRSQSDIWRIPVSGSPAENTRAATRVTRQTGQVQTPSVSPDGRDVVYLSDSGGHTNLWIARTDGSATRQITFDHEPTIATGVPVWSPRGDLIAFVRTREGLASLWVIRPNGSGLRQVVQGWAPAWSGDGRWLYYWWLGDGPLRLEKMPIDGSGPSVVVREEPRLILPAISRDGSALYYTIGLYMDISSMWGHGAAEIRRARPESSPSEVLCVIPGARMPGAPGRQIAHIALSPDEQWLATSLVNDGTTNLWVLPTAGGSLRQITDFGDRTTTISRSVSWAPDGQSIYAAVAETESDVVLFDGLIGSDWSA